MAFDRQKILLSLCPLPQRNVTLTVVVEQEGTVGSLRKGTYEVSGGGTRRIRTDGTLEGDVSAV